MGETHDRFADGRAEPLRLFLGVSPATANVQRLIERAARVDSTVLIVGESGVGKELVAREIHSRSARRHHAFVPLNCAAIPETLIESELFGSERGAYTDSRRLKRGVFEMADAGVLFLDEVGDLSLTAQPKLLRALEANEIVRVGGEEAHPVDLRIIAATNQNLKQMCRDQRFRHDLYYRLCVIEIRVPPLRERTADIRVLAEHFAQAVAEKTGREFTAISEPALRRLESHSWPGNVRELKSVIERALALSSGYVLDATCFDLDPLSLPVPTGASVMEKDWRAARGAFEAAYVQNLLRRHSGNVQEAAKAAGLAPGSIYKMLRRLGMRTIRRPR